MLSLKPGADRPPVSKAQTLQEKDALAEWIVKSCLQRGSSTLESALEREADIRLCSLLTRHLSMIIFGPSGANYLEPLNNIIKAMGYCLEAQPSGRVADTRALAHFTTPVKYRGFGSTLNNPEARGHIFQINMLSFIVPNPIIGVMDHNPGSPLFPTKGMKEIGTKGVWRLFEMSTSLTDDMTGLLIKADNGNALLEFAYFTSVDDDDPKSIYRINTAR